MPSLSPLHPRVSLLVRLSALAACFLTAPVLHAAGQDGQGEDRADRDDTPPPASDPAEVVDITRTDPIVVTATRTERTLFSAPAFADVVTSKDIDERMYRTVPDALRDVPGVMVQKTGHGQGSPYIRGFTGFRNLFLIDGIRLNNSVFRDGPNQYWNTVDPYSIDRMEVVKGPSSVLYGSDAIGGTVNVLTRSPSGYGEGFQWGGRGYYRISSAERSHVLRGELDLTWNDTFGFLGGATYKDYGDLESGAGRQDQTGYDELDADFKAEYFLNPDARILVAHQQVDQDNAWRTHPTIHAQGFHGTTVGSELRRVLDQNRELTYAQLHAQNLNSFVDAAHFSVSFQSQSEERNRLRNDGRIDIQGFDADTLGVWSQFESASEIGLWTYGVEYYHDDVDSFRRDYNADGTLNAIQIQGPVADDATYDLAGVYLQYDLPISDRLDLIIGGRFTYAEVDANEVEDPETGDQISISEDYDSIVGSIRFLYQLDSEDHWHLFGGVSQGFRAPNLSDLTRLDTARSNEIETPSPGLDPEEFLSYEIGVKTRYDDLFAQVSYYYTDIDDMIIRQPTGNVIDGANEVTKRNSGSGYVQGIEFGASWQFEPGWTLFGNVAWQDGEVDTYPTSAPVLVREPIDRLMPLMGEIGLRWDAPNREFWVESVLWMSDNQDKLSTRDQGDTQRIPPGGTPGYAVLSFRSGWDVTPDLTLTAALENVGDVNYRIHGSGLNEAGLNLIFGLEYRF